MRIIVAVKQVPDTKEVKVHPKTGTLIREGVPSIINPVDKNAIEEALRIKESNDDVEITVLSMGPPQAEMALREALAMGADRAILLSDRAFSGADTMAIPLERCRSVTLKTECITCSRICCDSRSMPQDLLVDIVTTGIPVTSMLSGC